MNGAASPRQTTRRAPGSAPATGRPASCPSRSTSRPPVTIPWWTCTTRRSPAPSPSGWKGSPVRRVVLCSQHDIASNFRRALPPAVAAKVDAEIPFDAAVSFKPDAGKRPQRRQRGAAARTHPARWRVSTKAWATAAVARPASTRSWAAWSAARSRRCSWTATTGPRAGAARTATGPGWTRWSECPICGGKPVPVADAVGELVRMAILQSSQVEVARTSPGWTRWEEWRRNCDSPSGAARPGAAGSPRRGCRSSVPLLKRQPEPPEEKRHHRSPGQYRDPYAEWADGERGEKSGAERHVGHVAWSWRSPRPSCRTTCRARPSSAPRTSCGSGT